MWCNRVWLHLCIGNNFWAKRWIKIFTKWEEVLWLPRDVKIASFQNTVWQPWTEIRDNYNLRAFLWCIVCMINKTYFSKKKKESVCLELVQCTECFYYQALFLFRRCITFLKGIQKIFFHAIFVILKKPNKTVLLFRKYVYSKYLLFCTLSFHVSWLNILYGKARNRKHVQAASYFSVLWKCLY